MNEFTKTPAAELWFEKADNYFNTVGKITKGNRFGCIEYYANAIRNTSSEAERKEMEVRITQSYAKYVNQVMKMYLNDIDLSKDFDDLGDYLEEFGMSFGPLVVEGICIIQENCGFYPPVPNEHAKLFTKTALDYLKLSISKIERIKFQNPVQYLLKSWFVCKIVYYGIYFNLDLLEDFFEELEVSYDLTKMRSAWWEALSELMKTLKKVEETAYSIQQNPHFKTALVPDYKAIEEALRKNKFAYDKVKKAEREKYFAEHPEILKKLKMDMLSLEKEISEIYQEIAILSQQIATKRREISEQKNSEKEMYQTQIKNAEQELSSLGLFKFSAKNALKEKIAELQSSMAGLNSKYSSLEHNELRNVNSQKATLEKRANEYKEELNQLKKELP